MFATISILVLLVFCLVTVVLPCRFPGKLDVALHFIRRRVLGKSDEVIFGSTIPQKDQFTSITRIWGVGAAVLFAIFATTDGRLFANHPTSMAIASACGLLAMGGSAALLLVYFALASYLPRLRAGDAAGRCGLRGLWIVDSLEENRRFAKELSRRIATSSKVCLVDVTGYELLGKGPGSGILHDILQQSPHLPVYILLCKPDARAVDPEKRQATVLQSLLAEMNMSQPIFLGHMNTTVEVVNVLNEQRSPEAKITIRFYGEKPTFRAILLDDSCVAIPWHAREDRGRVPYLDIARETQNTSFYESYRRHFARLWGMPLDATTATPRRRGLPERVVSGAGAIRPPRVASG